MKRINISNLLRSLGLLELSDKVRFWIEKYRLKKQNDEFKRNFPSVRLPPDYLIYESFQLSYHKYFLGGQDSAKWVVSHLAEFKELSKLRILDWGCGPGRIIRHVPGLVDQSCRCYGTDYNPASIDWCKSNLKGIEFNLNSIEAKLPYEDDFFDFIYGISIFTHLSEESHYSWKAELLRVLKPDGILMITTQGNNFKVKLDLKEIEQFEKNKLVVRGRVLEGHRTYSAFHPPKFIRMLFEENQVLRFIEEDASGKNWVPQDTWIIQP